MITPEKLNSAITAARPLFSEIQRLYQRLPETRCRCDLPGVCCTFLPEMTWVEALHWTSIIKNIAGPPKVKILRKFIEFYLTTPMRHCGCPFLIDRNCSIYDHRPFACRAYGLWSKTMGNTRTKESRRSRKELIHMWKRFGVDLPPEMVEFEIDYCDKVDCLSPKSVSDDYLMEILLKIYQLDQQQSEFQQEFEHAYHSDVSFLFASFVLGHRKAILGKFAVIKEMVQVGTGDRLQRFLEQVRSDVFRTSKVLQTDVVR